MTERIADKPARKRGQGTIWWYRYRILALLALVTGLIGYKWTGLWLIDNYATNLSATFVGTLVLLYFIDRTNAAQTELERSKREMVALKQTRIPLIHIVELFSDMIKAARIEPFDSAPLTVRELVEQYQEEIDWLDLDGISGTLEERTWDVEASETLRRTGDKLSGVIDKYAPYLGLELISEIEALRDSHFWLILQQIGDAKKEMRAQGIHHTLSLHKLGEHRTQMFERLLTLIDYYENSTGERIPVPSGLTRNDVLPRAGTSRLPELREGWGIGISDSPPRIEGNENSLI